MNYNLLQEEWIPVLHPDGRFCHISAMKALEQAREVRCIALASPLDVFAVHRFLLTLLYWKAELSGGVEHVRESLLKGTVPSEVIKGIKAEARCFDLFDDKAPFLQDPSVRNEKNLKSAGSLFAELPSGSYIAHFYHTDDERVRLCLPCITLGMLRLIPWSQQGGQGLSPSIHGAPPFIAMASSDSLGITLGLNLVFLGGEAGQPRWFGHFKATASTKPIPYMEALTWNPRRICLTPTEKGICRYCGQSDVPTVGQIVYLKNENTRLSQGRRKGVSGNWHEPGAFYWKDEAIRTAKSTKEDLAMCNKDLAQLLGKHGTKKEQSPPESFVFKKNKEHQRWYLVIPCTAQAKTFDHRQIELTTFSPETIRTLLPVDRLAKKQKGLDGWNEPKLKYPQGIRHFVEAAAMLFTCDDWVTLSNAAYRQMHESSAGFDVLSGLYWGLRDKKMKGLPSPNVAWLMLKLMASVSARARMIRPNAKFNPLRSLRKRQLGAGGKVSLYPISLPRGFSLEAAMRAALVTNMRKRNPELIDWIGLCDGLDQLIDQN
jgi:hypothetical protein